VQFSLHGLQFAVQKVSASLSPAPSSDVSSAYLLPETWAADDLPWMRELITHEVEQQWPPFVADWYGQRYRQFAADPDWLARSFVANAEKEAAGARSLWLIAAEAHEHPFAGEIADHARDEARHARMYLGMLDMTFPGALVEDDATAMRGEFPVFSDGTPEARPARSLESLLDDLVQMNIGEIRTRLHQLLLRPVALAVAPVENRQRLALSLNRIYEDEGRHIIYTARILEAQAASGHGALIASLYERRLADFAVLTLEEVGAGAFD
jgi:hypothetical protein